MTRFIPEWKPQCATIIAMPHKDSDWKPYLAEIQAKMCEIIAQIARFQRVIVLYKYKSDIASLATNPRMILLQIALNDSWCRDFAPLSVVKKSRDSQDSRSKTSRKRNLILTDFIFNAWGAKYASNLDNLAGEKIFAQLKARNFFKKLVFFKKKNFILEGGSIESNGNTLLTTQKCLLEPNRNRLSKAKITQKLKKYFGVKNIIWLKNGYLEGDDTDCHIDNLARFVDKKTIVYLKCYDKNDAHFRALEAMEKELQQTKFNLVPLPLPKAIYYDKKRLPASYVNFIFANGAIFVPTFGDKKNDKIALQSFKKLVKNREVIPIDSQILIRQGGGLHCASMQIAKI